MGQNILPAVHKPPNKGRLTKGGYTVVVSGIGVINACSPMKESLTSELFEDESDHHRYQHFLSI